MIAGLSSSSCCGVTPFNVGTPTSNPPLANARKKNTIAYTRNSRAANTMRPAPLRTDCSLAIVSSLLSLFAPALDDIAKARLACGKALLEELASLDHRLARSALFDPKATFV